MVFALARGIAGTLSGIAGGASAAVAEDLVKSLCQGQWQPVSGQLTVTGGSESVLTQHVQEPELTLFLDP